MLNLTDISHLFPRNQTEVPLEVVRKINLSVRSGQFVCFVGPNGCGKTTLLRIIAGLIRPSHGKVTLSGREITAPGEGIGLVFQEFALLPWRTVWRNIELGLAKKNVGKPEWHKIIGSYVSRFGLEGFEQCFPKELSGGMKQKVAIARALVNEPEVLLMDEPFASLDAQSRNFLQEFLVRMWQRSRRTIIFVTHNVDEAIFMSERIVLLGRRPAEVKLDIGVDLPYPRDRTCTQLNRMRKSILEALREETPAEYSTKLGFFSSSD